MKLRMVVAGVTIALSGWLSLGCGNDELIKWKCDCGNACATNSGDAKSASYDARSFSNSSCDSYNSCDPTGDVCACPDGADKCAIVP